MCQLLLIFTRKIVKTINIWGRRVNSIPIQPTRPRQPYIPMNMAHGMAVKRVSTPIPKDQASTRAMHRNGQCGAAFATSHSVRLVPPTLKRTFKRTLILIQRRHRGAAHGVGESFRLEWFFRGHNIDVVVPSSARCMANGEQHRAVGSHQGFPDFRFFPAYCRGLVHGTSIIAILLLEVRLLPGLPDCFAISISSPGWPLPAFEKTGSIFFSCPCRAHYPTLTSRGPVSLGQRK